jgi:hypothetical protein
VTPDDLHLRPYAHFGIVLSEYMVFFGLRSANSGLGAKFFREFRVR